MDLHLTTADNSDLIRIVDPAVVQFFFNKQIGIFLIKLHILIGKLIVTPLCTTGRQAWRDRNKYVTVIHGAGEIEAGCVDLLARLPVECNALG